MSVHDLLWGPKVRPRLITTMPTSIDRSAVDAGATFINSGAFYGNSPHETANLELLKRFFDAYPEYVDKVVLSVKGGAKGGKIFTGIDAR